MAERYDEMDGETYTSPGILGQVSGPRSWSEYQTDELADGPDCNFDRNNCTPLPDAPDTGGRFVGPTGARG